MMRRRAVSRLLILIAILATVLLGAAGAEFPGSTARAQSPAADLEVLVQAPSDAVVGREASFSVLVANHGPSSATGGRVAVQLSGSFDLVSIVPRAASCAPPDRSGTIVCDVPELPLGTFGVVGITVTPTAAGEITISATVSANEPDPNPGNNTASASVTVRPKVGADLSPLILAPAEAFVGQPAFFAVRIHNNGPDDEPGARLRVTVAGAFSDLGVMGIHSFRGDGVCAVEGAGTLVCDLGLIPPTPVAFFGAFFQLVPTAPGTIRIDAEVSGNEPDLNPSNNVASALIAVRAPLFADLAVALADSPDPVGVGRVLTYYVTAVNNGPDAASDVQVFDSLPGDVWPVAIETSQGTCDPLPVPPQPVPFIACSLGRLEPGGSASIRIEVLPTAGGTLVSSAFVSDRAAGEFDPEPTNNSASVTTQVLGPNRAGTFTKNEIFPVSLTVFVPCAGDVVLLEGNLHSTFHLTIDATGSGHFESLLNAQGVSGFGLFSGVRYQGTGVTRGSFTFSPPLTRTFTFVENQRFVGQGAAADLILHENMHVTFTPDGEIRASVDNFRLECG